MATLAAKLLFCEGGPGSPDAIIVRAAVASRSVTVRPVGSKRALMSFLQDPMLPAGCSYIAIRDRDFDFPPDEHATGLLRAHRNLPIYAWGRLELENYFLDGPVLKDAYDALPSSIGATLPAVSEKDLAAHLEDGAREIISYQVARWALGQLRPSSGWPYLRRDWCDPFRLPDDCCRKACWEQVVAEVQRFATPASQVNEGRARDLFDEFHAKFKDPDFLAGDQHVTWFSGRDLLASLVRHLGLPIGAAKLIAQHARDALRHIGPANSHADFAALAQLAAQL